MAVDRNIENENENFIIKSLQRLYLLMTKFYIQDIILHIHELILKALYIRL